MDAVQRFRDAIESGDFERALREFAPDITFHSPVKFTPFEGIEQVSALFRVLARTFEDFRYVDELAGDGTHALIFEARVGDRELQGLDHIRTGPDGRISEFTVMVRPVSGLMALAERMGPALAEAGVG